MNQNGAVKLTTIVKNDVLNINIIITNGGGFKIITKGDKMDIAVIMLKRTEFAAKYCEEKGWDVSTLSFKQILEIRSKDEWKNPKGDENESI